MSPTHTELHQCEWTNVAGKFLSPTTWLHLAHALTWHKAVKFVQFRLLNKGVKVMTEIIQISSPTSV